MNQNGAARSVIAWRFSLAGGTLGLVAGLYEAWLLYSSPRLPVLLEPDVGSTIWFLAPLVALGLFAVLGLALGLVAGGARQATSWRFATLAAAGLGAVGFYGALASEFSRAWYGYRLAASFSAPSCMFVGVYLYALLFFRVAQSRTGRFFDAATPTPFGWLAKLLLAAVVVCASGTFLHVLRHSIARIPEAPSSLQRRSSPNIALIVLDTVRADHLSAYGYFRPITPNLDRLANQGVVFENAVAPSSWTLATDASILTGLLPHQHGANSMAPLKSGIRTLAEALESHGYETAGFNANPAFGLAGWGIGRGFDVYEDDSSSLRHDLAATVPGRAVLQPLYERLFHYDNFDRRDAREINRDILTWYRHRSNRPFFLFVNYFDAHYPYVAPGPYHRRFGQVSESLMRRAGQFVYRGHVPRPSADEQASLVTGYDNCLAFLDEQVGQLAEFLALAPDGSNTIVIITADHGEAFGEHELYGHGQNLYRELLHVPLIFLGPGIPSGLRVTHIASLRELFPTIHDLVLSQNMPVGPYALRRFWTQGYEAVPSDQLILSELHPVLSLFTSEWHYLRSTTGVSELYHWPIDPQEKMNLSDLPQYRHTVQVLQKTLESRIDRSVKPWRGPDYILAIRGPIQSHPTEAGLNVQLDLNLSGPSLMLRRPPIEDQDLLQSIPYH